LPIVVAVVEIDDIFFFFGFPSSLRLFSLLFNRHTKNRNNNKLSIDGFSCSLLSAMLVRLSETIRLVDSSSIGETAEMWNKRVKSRRTTGGEIEKIPIFILGRMMNRSLNAVILSV
jgi:hypothetical protein